MTWDRAAWPKYLVTGGAININPDGNVLECDMKRADGTAVSFALDRKMAEQVGQLALALGANKSSKTLAGEPRQ